MALTSAQQANIPQFFSINVRAFSLKRLVVDWVIKPTNLILDDYTFSVFRSQSQDDDDFLKIIDGLKDVFSFHDPIVAQKSKWRQWFYKVRVTEDATELFVESAIASNDAKPDRIALAIIAKQDNLLKRFTGVPAFILKERTFGQRCGLCFDTRKMRRKTDNCGQCFNTGFVGGFFDPIPTFANLNPSAKTIQFAHFGEVHPDQVAAWISNFPEVKPRDILVEENDGKRWRIIKVEPTRKRRSVVHQTLLLAQINRSDIEWTIPIPEMIEQIAKDC